MNGLTPRQVECLDAVRDLSSQGIGPTVGEVRDRLGLASTSGAHRMLLALKARGYVDWRPREARSLRIIEADVSPAALEQLSDGTLRKAAAIIAGILATRGSGYAVASAYRNIADQLLQPGRGG